MVTSMKSLAVAAVIAGSAVAAPGDEWQPAPACTTKYEEYACDDGKGGEYTTTYTIVPKGCPGYKEYPETATWDKWSSKPVDPTYGWETYKTPDPSTWATYTTKPYDPNWKPYDPKPTTWNTWQSYDPKPSTWNTWEPYPPKPTDPSNWNKWDNGKPPGPWSPPKCDKDGKDCYYVAPPKCADDKCDYYPVPVCDNYGKCAFPPWWKNVPYYPDGKKDGWENYSVDDGKKGDYDWTPVAYTTVKDTNTDWNVWTTAAPKPPQEWDEYYNWVIGKVVKVITVTETYKVPCETGWEESTKVWYTTHCGCTETPVPSKAPVYVYTTECPESWGVGKTVTVTVPVATWTPAPVKPAPTEKCDSYNNCFYPPPPPKCDKDNKNCAPMPAPPPKCYDDKCVYPLPADQCKDAANGDWCNVDVIAVPKCDAKGKCANYPTPVTCGKDEKCVYPGPAKCDDSKDKTCQYPSPYTCDKDNKCEWNSVPVKGAETWSTYATPVKAAETWSTYAATWSAVATPVKGTETKNPWSPVATWKGAASSVGVSQIMVAAAGAFAGLALFL